MHESRYFLEISPGNLGVMLFILVYLVYVSYFSGVGVVESHEVSLRNEVITPQYDVFIPPVSCTSSAAKFSKHTHYIRLLY